jgi:hypothetical protein
MLFEAKNVLEKKKVVATNETHSLYPMQILVTLRGFEKSKEN